MRKKWFILAFITVLVGIGVYLILPQSFAPDNSSGDICPKCKSTNVGKYFMVYIEKDLWILQQ